MLQNTAKIFGVTLLLIGILGFMPALTPEGKLLGIFEVDTLHNLIHFSSGVVALLTGFASEIAARRYFQIFGIIYGIVTVLGLFYGNNELLGIMAHNIADIVLHLFITISALTLGFGTEVENRKVTHS
jgi:hypothetical protein